MKFLLILLALSVFIICLTWAILRPGFDSISASATALLGIVGAFFTTNDKTASQSQNVSNNSTAIQAGRDIKILKGDDDARG